VAISAVKRCQIHLIEQLPKAKSPGENTVLKFPFRLQREPSIMERRRALAAALFASFVLATSACPGAETATSPVPAINSPASMTVNDGIGIPFYMAAGTAPAGSAITWSLSGTDSSKFTINSVTGSISFKSLPNFAAPADVGANNEYDFVLTASDGDKSASLPVAIRVVPWNDGGAAGLPVPPVTPDKAKPAGTAANLKVLPWAGFKAAATYTFDDSSPSQIQNLTKLLGTGVRSTFNIVPTGNWYAGYDAAWQSAVAAGSELGNHTFHHCKAGDLNGANPTGCAKGTTIDDEIDGATDYITAHLGQSNVWTFAYPFGDLGYQSAAKKRFFLSRGVWPGMIGPDDATDPSNVLIIARSGEPTPPGGDAESVFDTDIDAALAKGKWVVFLFHTILPSSQNWGAGENVAVVTGSMDHAKRLGTVWLDSFVNIGSYWVGQKLLETAAVSSSGAQSTWRWELPANFPKGRKVRVKVDGGKLSQNGTDLAWDAHGYYEVSLDAKALTWSP
jgi:peptidoglycan/xylan/chitin deacetylase (PgdA/CDA1 family)